MVIIGNASYVVSKYALGQNSDGLSNIKIVGDESSGYYIGFAAEDDENKILTLDEVVDKIMKELKENGDVLKDYISDDETEQKELLKKLIKADIYTKYPKFNDDDDKLQGCVKIVKNDENKTMLKYKPYDDFKKLIESNNIEVSNYYSLNDEGNLVLASMTQSGENNNIISESSPIDFTTNLNKYALPFDYLWALLVETGDIEFIENIINLVLKSEVEITVFEEITTITTYTTEKHTEKVTSTKVAEFKASGETNYHWSTPTETISEPTEQSVQSTTTKTQIAEITNANTWILEIKKDYKTKTKTTGNNDYPTELESIDGNSENTVNREITNSGDDGWYKKDWESFKANNKDAKLTFSENVTTKLYDYKFGTNTYTEKIEYEEGKNETKEKTEKDSNEDNFVTYLVKSKKALDELKITDDWFYEMLEENERAEYMIDVTKYLMYKATGKDYGVTELDLDDISAIDESKFVSTFGTGFWWPIGSEETTEKDGKTFASGEPELGKDKISRAGKAGSKYNGYLEDPTHEKGNNGAAVDIAANGQIGRYYVISIGNGTVTKADDGYADNGSEYNTDNDGMGNCVYVDYGNGFVVRYMHMAKGSIEVSIGEEVSYGQVIGKIGHSGNSSAAHLHIDGTLNGEFIDMTEYIDPDNPRPQGGGNGVDSNFYKFLLLSEGGTQYIRDNGYEVFNNGVDSNLELTCGCAIGTLNGDKYCSGILEDNQYKIGAIVTREQYSRIFEGKVQMRAEQLDAAMAAQGVTLEQYQYDAIMSFLWQFGHTEEKAYSYAIDILDAYKSNGDNGFKNYIYSVGGEYSSRREREYKLFSTGDYQI